MSDERIFITNLRFWLLGAVQLLAFFCLLSPLEWTAVDAQGQRVLEAGLDATEAAHQEHARRRLLAEHHALLPQLSLLVESELIVDSGVTIQIETGVQIYFATGVGLKVYGTIGNEFAHIQMLPYQEQLHYDDTLPEFRLIDGPTVRQGRLQMRFRDRWRSVCTMITNWTSIDTGTACRSMGYSDGGFWKWYLRNNDTYPLVMPHPGCRSDAQSLWECEGFADASKIRMSENLCQGEDDLGLYCWGPPTFTGWARHWKGLQIYSSPFNYVPSDPDMFVDILYAGYDGYSKNVTPALYIEGVPPIMNGLRVQAECARRDPLVRARRDRSSSPTRRSSRTAATGSSSRTRPDGRLFVNYTLISGNYGDGIWYRQQFLGEGIVNFGIPGRYKRQSSFYEMEKPRIDMCEVHAVPDQLYFPHTIKAHLQNGSTLDALQPIPCWTIKLPPQLEYVYTLQFLSVSNRNLERSNGIGFPSGTACCPSRWSSRAREIRSSSALEHDLGPLTNGHIHGDVDLLFRVHASVPHKSFYGLNVTNSVISNNTGNGIQAVDVRDRFALTNVTLESNQGLAGVLVRGGAADLWINDTSMNYNWGDGMNVSYAGGSVNLNTSRLIGNRWRGFAFHLNTSLPFHALRHEIVMKGRPANNIFYPEMLIADNWWGGVLVGNFCLPADRGFKPKVLLSWIRFDENHYHPHAEVFACQSADVAQTAVEVTGNAIRGGTGLGFRMEPAVNTRLVVNSNHFHNIRNSALLVRNARHPQLRRLPARVEIWKNEFKGNVGPEYIVSIGLNEDAPQQSLEFSQQNEARSSPYAALVVSSSNVVLHYNCFGNPQSDFEIATSLMEHAKVVDASKNNWGDRFVRNFQHRIFDQFNRYSLARINIEPYAAICNQVVSAPTHLQENYRHYKNENQPFVIGGTIYENDDLPSGRYTVVEDLHIMPGEVIRADHGYTNRFAPIKFTSQPFKLPKLPNIRLMNEWGDEDVLAGRLEVKIEDQWGTICNRSWTAQLAQLACNQLGLTMDPQYFENWRIFVSRGDQPMIMDNLRCEEREYDITKCRHDGNLHNIQASCRPTEVVGFAVRPPLWAGVRYSLYASPPTITGQTTMDHWIIEKAGLFDFRTSTFSPALQIDWNYHTFHNLTIRDNFGDGLYVVYNDLTKKPAIHYSRFTGNRLNGVTISDNQNAGVRYDPQISAALQRDIVSWLDASEQPELVANNSQLKHRFFLKASLSPECPLFSYTPCIFETTLVAESKSYGMTSKLVVQIVNRPNNESDEEAVLIDPQTRRRWSTRANSIEFPITSSARELTFRYSRSYGAPKLYLDRFVHVYESVIANNQYGVSAVHYSNLTFADGAVLNRWSEEKIWFQKVNFTDNNEAVVWIHSPQHDVPDGTPLAEITWHIDNCSIFENHGPVIDTHRDLYASANIFHWIFWSNTFENNTKSGINMTENRFQGNTDFYVHLGGFYTFAEHGHWMVRVKTDSHSLRSGGMEIPSFIQFNYFQFNWFLQQGDDYVDMYPRSFAVGVFGSQKVDVHYNRLKNPLMDFELVAGCTPQIYGEDVMNVTYNWFGVANEAEVSQRIFDLDDWNIFTIANFTPFYLTEEQFLNFWWHPLKGQLSFGRPAEPNPLDLKGRMYESKTLDLNPERWYTFRTDLTIMPGATLRIEKNVEVHVAPNVRILVLGDLVCDGTLWQPNRFKPLNTTEIAEEEGRVATRYRRAVGRRRRPAESKWADVQQRHAAFLRRRWKRAAESGAPRSRLIFDPVFKQFPSLRRDDPYFQEFQVHLTSKGVGPDRSGFPRGLQRDHGRSGASCATSSSPSGTPKLVCRELGFDPQNAYHWITPRYDYDPRLRLVKTYVEPRECRGDEPRLDKCPCGWRPTIPLWMCVNAPLTFNYVHCGDGPKRVNDDYAGQWGGITFAHPSLELVQEAESDGSILRHVEIVGGGQAHNQTVYAAALQVIRRSPILENVNVTNSSMNGVQIVSPRSNLALTRLNISDNNGQGMSIVSTNLQAASPGSAVPKGPLNLPYNVVGMLDVCAAGKTTRISNRILVYYKYDSRPVDCVKIFKSTNGKSLGFRFLQVNLYDANNHLGRTDALSIFDDESFSPFDLVVLPTRSTTMSLHLRATAADGEFGFIAEVSTLPSTPDGRNVEEVAIRNSRFQQNDRGAVQYRNCGEIGPNLIVEQCLMDSNGYHLYGNVSTSAQTMELFLYRGNAIHNNRGGLLVTAESSSAVARLLAIIKNSAFLLNTNSTASRRDREQRSVEISPSTSTPSSSKGMSVNFTHNIFTNNTALHTVDTQGHSRIASDAQYFEANSFIDNIALGHGNQYLEHYGHLPPEENDEFRRRPKRQVLTQRGVGLETERYRATVVAGSSLQRYVRNIFNNPLNDYELTTSVETQFVRHGSGGRSSQLLGLPGHVGRRASGKVLDKADYPNLVRANYEPILESNTSLIEGDCPPGWFQAGNEEFKSCFLFVGASMTYAGAVRFCEEMDAFMPILRADDSRQKELAARIDDFGSRFITEAERYNSFGISYDIPVWVSSVTLPSNQCGWMSSRTAAIAEHNCNNLLPFARSPTRSPVLWRRDIVVVVLLLLLLLIVIALLLICACRKAQRRSEHQQLKKQFYRESMRRSRNRGERPANGGAGGGCRTSSTR
ncbi:hypothetical protein M3Y99_01913900 [Aphelenchoides fujianensis]|nr:hypothetical protein M3Y99_01913900 [Aphelenchoides fujianensis]